MELHERHAFDMRNRYIGRWVRKVFRCIAELWRRRAVAAQLRELDDFVLKDIGLVRSDIPAIANGTFHHDETRRSRGYCSSTIGEASSR